MGGQSLFDETEGSSAHQVLVSSSLFKIHNLNMPRQNQDEEDIKTAYNNKVLLVDDNFMNIHAYQGVFG